MISKMSLLNCYGFFYSVINGNNLLDSDEV